MNYVHENKGGKLTINNSRGRNLRCHARGGLGSVRSEVQFGLTREMFSVVFPLGGDFKDGGDIDRRSGGLIKCLYLHGLTAEVPLHFEVLHRSHADDVTNQQVVDALHHLIRDPDKHNVRRF